MNLFADESVDRPVVERLRQDSHDVAYVAELAPSITDDEVLRNANDRSAVLVTADKDFGELVFRQGAIHRSYRRERPHSHHLHAKGNQA